MSNHGDPLSVGFCLNKHLTLNLYNDDADKFRASLKWREEMMISNFPNNWVRFAAVGAVVLLLGACENGRTDYNIAHERVAAYLAQHPNTTPEFSRAMRNMDLVKGMTPAEVRASWGDPTKIAPSLRGISEIWSFNCDYPHSCGSGGRKRRGIDERSSRATFIKGRLVEWRR